MVQGLKTLSCRRLNKLDLHSWERRRLREDLTGVFKWIKELYREGWDEVLTRKTEHPTMGTS